MTTQPRIVCPKCQGKRSIYVGCGENVPCVECNSTGEKHLAPTLDSAVMRASYVYVPDAEELAARLRAEAASYHGSQLLSGDLARAANLVELLARHEPIASLLYLVDLHEKIMRTAPTEAQRIAAAVRKAYKVVRLADHHGIRLEGLESARRLVREFDRSLAESGQAPQ